MKRFSLNIFFSFLVGIYVFSTVGVCVIAHYCGGELEKISLFSKTETCCDGQDDESDDCCKDDSRHVVFQKDFTFISLVSKCEAASLNLFVILPSFITISHQPVSQKTFLADKQVHPPDLVQHDLVSSSVIRI